jgi:hypothetical protein
MEMSELLALPDWKSAHGEWLAGCLAAREKKMFAAAAAKCWANIAPALGVELMADFVDWLADLVGGGCRRWWGRAWRNLFSCCCWSSAAAGSRVNCEWIAVVLVGWLAALGGGLAELSCLVEDNNTTASQPANQTSSQPPSWMDWEWGMGERTDGGRREDAESIWALNEQQMMEES